MALIEEEITRLIISAFYAAYDELGPGYREYVYVLGLERELKARGLKVEREVWVMIYYKGEPLAKERMDMLVEGKVLIDAKATPVLDPKARTQPLRLPHGH